MIIPFPEILKLIAEWGWPLCQMVQIKSESDSPTQKHLKSGIIHDRIKVVAILIFFFKMAAP